MQKVQGLQELHREILSQILKQLITTFSRYDKRAFDVYIKYHNETHFVQLICTNKA